MLKISAIPVLIFILLCLPVNAQDTAVNEQAVTLFIEGKSLELRGKYDEAFRNYQACLQYEKTGGIYFSIAKVNLMRGKYQDAIIEINNALKYDPDNIEFLTLKGSIYQYFQKLDKAINIFGEILAKNPENLGALYSMARCYQDLNDPQKALPYYEKITDLYGFDQDVLRRMYEIYKSFGNFEKSAEVISYMLVLDPYDINKLLELASLYSKLGRDEEAKKIYLRLSALNPENKQVQAEIVKLYFNRNEIEKGFSEFALLLGKDTLSAGEKIQLGELYFSMVQQQPNLINIVENIFIYISGKYPDNWLPYYYLAQIDIQNKRNESAAAKLNKSFSLADTTAEAFIQIGYSLFTLEKYEDAKSVLEKGLEKNFSDFRLHLTYGLTMQRLNDLPAAIVHFEKAEKLNPNDLNVLSSLALAYNSNKQYKESDGAYERALIIDPDNALILNNYAYNLSTRGQSLDKALEMAHRAIRKEPNNPSYLDTIGWIYYMMKDYKTAKDYIEKAVSINGSNAVLLEHLGDTYFALKDNQRASYFWRKALELSPDNNELKEKIKNVE